MGIPKIWEIIIIYIISSKIFNDINTFYCCVFSFLCFTFKESLMLLNNSESNSSNNSFERNIISIKRDRNSPTPFTNSIRSRISDVSHVTNTSEHDSLIGINNAFNEKKRFNIVISSKIRIIIAHSVFDNVGSLLKSIQGRINKKYPNICTPYNMLYFVDISSFENENIYVMLRNNDILSDILNEYSNVNNYFWFPFQYKYGMYVLLFGTFIYFLNRMFLINSDSKNTLNTNGLRTLPKQIRNLTHHTTPLLYPGYYFHAFIGQKYNKIQSLQSQKNIPKINIMTQSYGKKKQIGLNQTGNVAGNLDDIKTEINDIKMSFNSNIFKSNKSKKFQSKVKLKNPIKLFESKSKRINIIQQEPPKFCEILGNNINNIDDDIDIISPECIIFDNPINCEYVPKFLMKNKNTQIVFSKFDPKYVLLITFLARIINGGKPSMSQMSIIKKTCKTRNISVDEFKLIYDKSLLLNCDIVKEILKLLNAQNKIYNNLINILVMDSIIHVSINNFELNHLRIYKIISQFGVNCGLNPIQLTTLLLLFETEFNLLHLYRHLF